jgi:hypothetical protein
LRDWLERVLASPALIEASITDPELESRFARIPEFGNRVLRVIVNTQVFLNASLAYISIEG